MQITIAAKRRKSVKKRVRIYFNDVLSWLRTTLTCFSVLQA